MDKLFKLSVFLLLVQATVIWYPVLSEDQTAVAVRDSRQTPATRSIKVPGAKLPSNSSCGNDFTLTRRIEQCSKPLMDILEGKLQTWPAKEKDVGEYCVQFIAAEKCIRDWTRRCATGIKRTILSTLANSVQRVRKRECQPAKYGLILNATMCVEKNQKLTHSIMANATSRLSVIELQMKDLDVKTNGLCCMVHIIEEDMKYNLSPKCPQSIDMIIRLYHDILEEVLEIICRKPKCRDVFKGYSIPKPNDGSGIVGMLLRIVFSLG